MKDKLTIQLIIACLVTLAGLVLLFCGFWVSPTGEIHNSVLVGFGEAISFAGALLGIDYTYKYRIWNRHGQKEDNTNNKQ
jgi:branched-subunit amino acid permease